VLSQAGVATSWYVYRVAKCLSNLWLRGLPHVPEITRFTVVGYPPFLLSGKTSTSQLLPLLTPLLLAPELEHVIDKSSEAMTTDISLAVSNISV